MLRREWRDWEGQRGRDLWEKKKRWEKERTSEHVDERWLVRNWEGISQGIGKVREV